MNKSTTMMIVLILIIMQFIVYSGHSITIEERNSLMEERAPIKINNDDEFWHQAQDGDWPGDGRYEDPYIISNFIIDATGYGYGIFIANTSSHFIIRECEIFNAEFVDEDYHTGAGIILINAHHGSVVGNEIHSNSIGVYSRDCPSVLVRGNYIYWHWEHGVSFNNVTKGQVWGNSIVAFGRGISLTDSHETAVISNYIKGALDPVTGIEQISSNSTHIGYNHVETFQYAINVTNTDNSHIRNNSIKDSFNKGLVLSGSNDNLIYYNRIFNSSEEGLLLDSESGRNIVYGNNFYFNNGTSNRYGDTGTSQAADRGSYNLWNDTNRGNYWYDWARNNMTNDADGDGMVDWPYGVGVSTGVADHLPMAKPILNERGNIRINSDSEFTWGNGVVDGNGTEENPFIIEGIYINARGRGDAFYVGNTTLHFIMRQCELANATNIDNPYYFGAGLAIHNITNARITDIDCHGNLHGVYVDETHGVYTEISTVHNNTIDGIRLVNTSNTTIKGNLVRNNVENGIFLASTTNISLTDNHCSHNGNGTLATNSNHLIFNNNSFIHSHNPVYQHTAGMIQVLSRGTVVTNNTFAYNAIGGILFQGDTAIFRNNNVSGNEAGFFFMNSDNNTIEQNNFSSTGMGINGNNLVDSEIVSNEFSQMPASIYLNNSRRLFINNNTFTSLQLGLYINVSEDMVLSYNNFTDIDVSVFLESSHNNHIACNHMDSSELGLYANHSHHNEFYHNEMWNSGIALTGDFETYTTQTIPVNNTVNGLPVYYLTDMGGGVLTGDYGQVILGNVTNMIVENLNIGNGTAGLGMGYCTYITVRNSNFSHHLFGMYMENTSHCDIHNNVFWYNIEYGLYIIEGSHSNHIYANSFVGNNGAGVQFNGSHVQARDEGYDNYWNSSYPQGGNHWSDWTAPDNYSGPNQDIPGRDGIVDDPYPVGGDVLDHYPLVLPSYPILPTEPENLNSTTGYGYVFLTWEEPFHDGNTDIIEYRIYRGLDPGSITYLDSVSAPVTSFNDTTVQNGVTYYYNLTAVNAQGESPPSSLYTIPGNSPGAPDNILAEAGDGYVYLSWDEPGDDGGFPVTEYRVYRGMSPGEEILLDNVAADEDHYNDTAVENWQNYHYFVTAVNERGESLPGTRVSAMPIPPAEQPSVPRDLAGMAGDGYVNLSWDEPTYNGNRPIVEYRIYRGTVQDELTYYDNVTVRYYNDTSVDNGEMYHYSVTAVNEAGLESPHSHELSVTPFGTPGAPTHFEASEGINRVLITWVPPHDDGGSPVTGYRVYRSHDGEDRMIHEGPANITIYSDDDILHNQTYHYRVSALNLAGEGPISQEVSVTITKWYTAPSQPSLFSALPGNGRVMLSWQPSYDDGGIDILGYRIYKGTRSGNLQMFTSVDNATLNYLDTDVDNQRVYYYRLEAYNQIGISDLSDEISVIPDGISPTVRILYPSANEEIQGSSVTIRWEGEDDNSGISHYEIRMGIHPWITLENQTEYTFEELLEGTHTVYIRGYDNAGNRQEESVTFRVVTSSTIQRSLEDNWLVILLAILISIAIGSGYILYNKFTNRVDKSSEAVIDEVFLISNSAILLAHNTRRLKPDMDDDILAGMLTAVQNFIKDSFKDEGDWRLNRLEFANNKILVERGEHSYMAVMYSGEIDDMVLEKVKDTIRQIEETFADTLTDWDGDMDKLRGVKDILRDIF